MTPAQSEGPGKRQKRAPQVHATTCNEHHLKQIEKSMDRTALIQQQHTRCECAG